MRQSIQTCNICHALNAQKDKTWVTSFGAFTGSPVPTLQQMGMGQNLPEGYARPVLLDFCPDCWLKVTTAQLLELSNPTPAPATKPA